MVRATPGGSLSEMAAVALPFAFVFGYLAGGLSVGIGAAAVTLGCLALGATLYARRYLRRL